MTVIFNCYSATALPQFSVVQWDTSTGASTGTVTSLSLKGAGTCIGAVYDQGTPGSTVQVMNEGVLSSATFSWTPLKPVYASDTGVLTQNSALATVFQAAIGFAMSPTEVYVRFGLGASSTATPTASKYTATIGDGVSKAYTLTHALNSTAVIVSTTRVSDGEQVYCDIDVTGVNTIVVNTQNALAASSLLVTVMA